MKSINGFPRCAQLEHMTPAERTIYDAVVLIEGLGADVRLTRAQTLLCEARELVAAWVDEQP
jgi:hypothetical protein